MSDDANKDIQKAINDSKKNGSSQDDSVHIPPPIILQHGLDDDGIITPPITIDIASKNKGIPN